MIQKKTLLVLILIYSTNFINASFAQVGLSDDQKISQLLALKIEISDFEDNFKTLKKECEDGIGMLIVPMGLNEAQTSALNDFLKGLENGALLVYQNDQSQNNWPAPLTFGAVRDNTLLVDWGKATAKSLAASGLHISMGLFPGLIHNDLNSESIPFGMNEDWEMVSDKSNAIYTGFKQSNTKLIIEDFPGFKNVGPNSALRIGLDEDRIKNVELKPYERLIKSKVDFIQMSASLTKKDEENFEPFFLSDHWIQKVLRRELNFKGLVISADISEVSNWYNAKNGELELAAFLAGNQIIFNPDNINATKRRLRQEMKKNSKFRFFIDESVSKIKEHKEEYNSNQKLSSVSKAKIEYHKVLRNSITALGNANLVPVKYLDISKIACIHFDSNIPNITSIYLDKYANIKHYYIADRFNYYQKFEEIAKSISDKDLIIISLGNIPFNAENKYGLGEQIPKFVRELLPGKKVIILAEGNARVAEIFPESVSYIFSYESNESIKMLFPQMLFGAKDLSGTLPFSSKFFPWNSGIVSKSLNRLDYVFPEEVGMNTSILSKIDEVAEEAIKTKATPGCQVLVARNGHIVLEKSYGFLSYDSLVPVNNETVYDIASVTKVAATLQGVMFLSERDVIDLNKTASKYLVELRNSNKDGLFISEILGHQAGLTPYIPHWKKTMDGEILNDSYYCDSPDDWFCLEVMPGLYSIRTMEDSIWKWTIESDLMSPNRDGSQPYRYSDLGFYIMKKLVERTSRQDIEGFLDQNFYKPLGMSKMTFFPLAYFNNDEIAPTEQDEYFRKDMIRGTVHDQGAAMLGGVGGHAGLFSNANDLAKLLQMNLNGGTYGGQRFLQKETLKVFTERHFKNNRRGLGWDKPLRTGNGPSSDLCSYNTFGHTGFTGTSIWADPDYGLVFVFLSNRIHPDVNNRGLIKQNIRTRIQDIVYESLFINDIKSKD